jgi:hypothetical protein
MTLLHVIKYNPDTILEEAIANNIPLEKLLPKGILEAKIDIVIPSKEEFQVLGAEEAKKKLRDILRELLEKYEGNL